MGAAVAAASPFFAQTRPAIRWNANLAGTSGLPTPDSVVHLVNRITFGMDPEVLARAHQRGFEGFVEEQLHPEEIDDSEVEAAVRDHFPTVGMRQLALERFDRLHVAFELKAATVYRAVAGRRQLFEMILPSRERSPVSGRRLRFSPAAGGAAHQGRPGAGGGVRGPGRLGFMRTRGEPPE